MKNETFKQISKEVMVKCLENSCGLTAYKETLTLRDKDISKDEKYQKNFTAYYRVRRDAEWLKEYYKFMEENKNNNDIDFATILTHLNTIPHKTKKGIVTTVEPSFASKMLATINPDYPIWDSQVTKALKIKVNDNLTGEAKINACIEAYKNLTNNVKCIIDSSEGKYWIKLFDEQFPNYKDISSYKKIDFYLWNVGK